MRFALIGQPNCGKSTLFNQVAGYKAETGNFTGTTVTYTESKVRIQGVIVELVDLPGTYTLTGTNPAERETLRYLASHEVDLIINVLDASHLAQGLTLTLELLELGRPLLVALNMMDEAGRMGMSIDGERLQALLGAPTAPLIASKGRGVRNLFVAALHAAEKRLPPQRPQYSPALEQAIHFLAANLNGNRRSEAAGAPASPIQKAAAVPLPPLPLAIKLLEGDESLLQQVALARPGVEDLVASAQAQVMQSLGRPAVWALSSARSELAEELAAQVVRQGERRYTWRDRIDDVLLHPLWGYLALVLILLALFQVIYGIGSATEKPLLAFFDSLAVWVETLSGGSALLGGVLYGLLQGVAGGVAIVLPYLLPFLFGLGFLEDIGYLPRVAFLMDALMHRMGLHGKAVVPFILGYGCNVPAVMSTRMMEEPRDRFLAATLATLVPCAARLAVVFGLVAFYLGPGVALTLYLFNLFVIALTGRVVSAMLPEDTPGMILEMPVYRTPTLKSVASKAWFRAREFMVEAWPILIIGSVVLALLNYYQLTDYLNVLTRPITWALDLPGEVGVPLIFGVLRKELSLIMLRQALGVEDFAAALNAVQMVTFSVFVMFYVPCLATLAMLKRELGWRSMLVIAGLTVVIALLAALAVRFVAPPFL